MRRSLLLALLALATALASVGAAAAQTPPPAPPPAPEPPPVEPTIAEGVTIARIPVGGMTREEAREAVQKVFDQRIRFAFRKRAWRVAPARLGAAPDLEPSLDVALLATPGKPVKLRVTVRRPKVRTYVAYLDRLFSKPPRSSQLGLRNLRPYLSKPRYGFDVKTRATETALMRALIRTERGTPIRLPHTVLRPSVTRANYGPVVVIRRESRRLYLYRGMRHVRTFRIAVGTPSHPTPLGRYRVITRERHPTWNPPDSPWAAGLGPVPPGPSNPLGTRWIGTSAPAIGIHGTPQPWTVGTAASHGCIRMYMREVEWLFERVRIGTPIFIVRA